MTDSYANVTSGANFGDIELLLKKLVIKWMLVECQTIEINLDNVIWRLCFCIHLMKVTVSSSLCTDVCLFNGSFMLHVCHDIFLLCLFLLFNCFLKIGAWKCPKWQWVSIHNSGTLKLKQLNGNSASLILLFILVLCPLWHVKMSSVKRVYTLPRIYIF